MYSNFHWNPLVEGIPFMAFQGEFSQLQALGVVSSRMQSLSSCVVAWYKPYVRLIVATVEAHCTLGRDILK
ncbi:MAG: hypothetical protein CMI26_11080 [Opitutae bacterium]|nr:hypothetical protein [Opitutae bacterium]|tara:strand:- start:1554 stop:1766 length:213 start_codon:yes stop_codon:yes gene_type:complete